MELGKNLHNNRVGIVQDDVEPVSLPAGEWRKPTTTSIPRAEQALRRYGAQGDPETDRSLDRDVGMGVVRMPPDHLAPITTAHERDLKRFAQRQRTAESAEPATWRSSCEAALFQLTLAVPGQNAGILETAYHAIASFIARSRSDSKSRSRRSVAIEALTGDSA